MDERAFDIAHLLAGGMVLVSFMVLYQDRMFGLLNVFALHAVVLSASVAWQASFTVRNGPRCEIALVGSRAFDRALATSSMPERPRP
jgi:hydrogenase-4 component E